MIFKYSHSPQHDSGCRPQILVLFQGPSGWIWVSSEIDITGASNLPYHADIGNHIPVVSGLAISLVMGIT